jgi:hypothetical protein
VNNGAEKFNHTSKIEQKYANAETGARYSLKGGKEANKVVTVH